MMSPWFWVGFNVFVLAMLLLDLLVFNRKAHVVRMREALSWSAFWIALSLAFNYFVYREFGREAGMNFLTGYLLEKALSVDNLFVFLLIFTYFKVPGEYQHKILFWGVLGALVLRAAFILLGAALISKFSWTLYLLGAFLVYTGVKMATSSGDTDIDPENNPVVKFLSRRLPITKRYEGGRFFVRREKLLYATPLFVVLVMVETTDVVFAADSIPAILAVTQDKFIVYTSNVFALLGLRALYFALAGLMTLFHYLHYGLALILVFIGGKLLLHDFIHIPTEWALGTVAALLALSIGASLLLPKKDAPGDAPQGQ